MKRMILEIKLNYLILLFLSLILISPACKRNKATSQLNKNKFQTDSTQIKIEELTQGLLKNPSNYRLYYQRAKLYQQHEKIVLAVKDMQLLFRFDSSDFHYYNFFGDLCIAANGYTNAIKSYQKSTSLNPADDYAFMKIGEVYLYLQDRDKSFKYLNEALRINKFNAKAYFLKAYNYLEMRDTAKAISGFQTCVDVDPDYYDSYINLGLIYARRKDKKAPLYYNSCLRLKPGSIEVLYNLGIFYQEIDSFDKAIEYYNEILKQVPDHKNASYNLGFIFALKGNFEKAVKYFTTAINKLPTYTDAWFARGQCYKKLGRNEQAMADFNKVLQLDPNYKLAEKELKKLNK
jgi:tetratricopeptide (TPR) repeat protein